MVSFTAVQNFQVLLLPYPAVSPSDLFTNYIHSDSSNSAEQQTDRQESIFFIFSELSFLFFSVHNHIHKKPSAIFTQTVIYQRAILSFFILLRNLFFVRAPIF